VGEPWVPPRGGDGHAVKPTTGYRAAMWGRLTVLTLAALVLALAGCSAGESNESAATTTTRSVHARTATERDREGGGGLLDALGSLLGEDKVGRCVERAATSASNTRPRTLRAVAREVERIRLLRFRMLPRPRYLRRQGMERRIRRELDKYPSAELTSETRALVALGAVPRGTNLETLMKRTLPGQIAGFYDPATGELVVGSTGEKGLDAVERLTLAHELEHALADQVLRMPRFLKDDHIPDGREDAEIAGLSLIEGDATLLTEAFAREHVSLADAVRSIGPALTAERQFNQLPHYLQASTIFPYGDGLNFVCSVFQRGGWKAVDRVYGRPPATSAQVMFPQRYFGREQAVDAPEARPPGPGWKLLDVQAFGAANLLWLFEAPGGDTGRELPDARERAAAWAGGDLRVFGRGGKTAVGLTLVERRGERDLCASMRAWFKAAERRGSIRCSGRIIRASLHP
jgi:hypothetical protein